MHTRIYKCAVMRWAHLQMRCANLQMRLHLNCENGRCRPLRRFPRHAAISPRQQGPMRRVSALTFTNAHFAHFYAQKGPFPKPQVLPRGRQNRIRMEEITIRHCYHAQRCCGGLAIKVTDLCGYVYV